MATTSEALRKAIKTYRKNHIKRLTLDFSDLSDNDILEKLDSVPNKRGYICSLIRADILAGAAKKKERK